MSGFSAYIDSIKTAASAAAEEIANQKIDNSENDAYVNLKSALTEQENSNIDVETKYLEYLNTFDDNTKKQKYTEINSAKKTTILDNLQTDYDIKIKDIEEAMELHKLLANRSNLNVNDYYKLKNEDLEKKISDISGISLTNKRKALYNLDYVNNIEKIKDIIFTIYITATLVYIIFFIRAKRYKSRVEILILIGVILYPFLINYVMKYILGLLDYIFTLAPVNAYRNIYNQDINLTTSNDDDIYLHYSRVNNN